jgi:hypothetical protein
MGIPQGDAAISPGKQSRHSPIFEMALEAANKRNARRRAERKTHPDRGSRSELSRRPSTVWAGQISEYIDWLNGPQHMNVDGIWSRQTAPRGTQSIYFNRMIDIRPGHQITCRCEHTGELFSTDAHCMCFHTKEFDDELWLIWNNNQRGSCNQF